MSFPGVSLDIKLAKIWGLVGTGLVVGAGVFIYLSRRSKSIELGRKAIKRRQADRKRIASELEALSRKLDGKLVDEMMGLDTAELIHRMREENLKPIDVLEAYLFKACEVNESLNCVTMLVEGCRETATSLDHEQSNYLPLYGLPVSLKECLNTKGPASTLGLAKYADKMDDDDCVLVKVLKQCGAVPFAKTNLSQLTMSFESGNPIYGWTSNPHNPNYSAGGSSGGEGALLASGASLLGFGTDLGGSLRVPCHLCGICSLKPTKLRLSSIGNSGPPATVGPMARNVDTLVLAMRALLCGTMFEMDCSVPPMKFNDEIFSSKERLRIGYYEDNDFMEPIPACKRAVRITKQALEEAGHTLVPFKFSDLEHTLDLHLKVAFSDCCRGLLDEMKYEEVDPCLQHASKYWKMNPIIRKLYSKILSIKSTRIANDLMAHGGRDGSVYTRHNIAMELEKCKAKFWLDWREKYNIDVLICPVLPVVACPKGKLVNGSMMMSYTIMYNILDCPAGTVSVTKVTKRDTEDLDSYVGHFGDDWDMHCKEACKNSINMPVGVQCVSPPWQEELCLRLMKEVEDLLVK